MFLTWNDADSVGLESGTLVWLAIAIFMTLQKYFFMSNMDRLTCKSGQTLFKNSDDSWLQNTRQVTIKGIFCSAC